jgi:hypothetical protein
MLKNLKMYAFYKDKDLSILSKVSVQKIVKRMVDYYYEEGTFVFEKHKPANSLVIVLQGILVDVDNQNFTIKPG